MGLLARLKAYAVAALALVAGVLGAYLFGRWKGGKIAADAVRDADAKAAAKAEHAQVQTRIEVENEAAKLKDAQPQRVGDADHATAAGRLRDEGWTRSD